MACARDFAAARLQSLVKIGRAGIISRSIKAQARFGALAIHFGESPDQVRVKRCGKSAPRSPKGERRGNLHPEQHQIGKR
jgi:hypothetical protein